MNILVTGAAGFIGSHVCQVLSQHGHSVLGIDNLNDYYDPELKLARLRWLGSLENFKFERADISHIGLQIPEAKYDLVIHLAAQAGVRYSIEAPQAYVQSNVLGTVNVLEYMRRTGCDRIIYASSSSVYGRAKQMPLAETSDTDSPVSLYAATKKATENIAHAYAELYGFRTVGLRFFTVYGPWGRPDMAYYKFAQAICAGKPIDVYNGGQMSRDFTYIDDIIGAIHRLSESEFTAKHTVYNLGSNNPIELDAMICALESHLGLRAVRNLLPMQKGDVYSTYADTTRGRREFGFTPSTTISDGIGRFVRWFIDYHKPTR